MDVLAQLDIEVVALWASPIVGVLAPAAGIWIAKRGWKKSDDERLRERIRGLEQRVAKVEGRLMPAAWNEEQARLTSGEEAS